MPGTGIRNGAIVSPDPEVGQFGDAAVLIGDGELLTLLVDEEFDRLSESGGCSTRSGSTRSDR